MTKKLPRAERRAQLLETAFDIVREQGTDALTLGLLAEQAGVSKPIAYSHFETRSGLMMALYKDAMDRQVSALAKALEDAPQEPGTIVRLLAQAYLECAATIGSEWHAIGAALRGDAMMDAYQREMREDHAAFYANALQPFSGLDPTAVQRRCIGLIASMEAISNEVTEERIVMEDAVDDLVSLIVTWIISRR
ncbi:TetR/AcrR family transcriptional regulator [Luteimonas deserti]|uniref:TetR/AcrR family transcriptional regulator n=1 Tax=Luteimonas deserti TaxID=2752306 RepID=A0A7Z0QPY2_9GAMM|nr:TetR/AcrR family transcriptional regulator [Luteimonas deserti]NYZ62024.1 TetR/AcrR family transcriptional regulator [Luteimonas deserti]